MHKVKKIKRGKFMDENSSNIGHIETYLDQNDAPRN